MILAGAFDSFIPATLGVGTRMLLGPGVSGVVSEGLFRFVVGGTVVSGFALLGALFKPTSFAGLFSAAPSVALATLALAIAHGGPAYASAECRSMVIGAAALGAYSLFVAQLLVRIRTSALAATIVSTGVWFVAAFGLWGLLVHELG